MNEYIKISNIFKRETFGNNRLIEGEFTSEELEFTAELTWRWTEKIDGTNIRVCWDGYRVSFRGRTDRAEIPKHLLNRLEEIFGGTNKEEIFEATFGETPVILYGEGYGAKIQKGGGLYGDVNFILFDILVGDYWLKEESLQDVAAKFGIKVVPTVGEGTLHEAVEYIRSHPKSMLRDYEMEGIVCRPIVQLFDRNRKPLIVKIKCRDFPMEDK